jgi:hypothetical protein
MADVVDGFVGLGALIGLCAFGWIASVQRGFLRVWAAWTVFCLILFPAILKTRGQLDTHSFIIAVILAPLAALIAWVWIYSGLRRRR